MTKVNTLIAFLILAATMVFNVSFKHEEQVSNTTLTVMTYNLRGDNPNDGVNQWQNRKHKVANLIKFYSPAILGVQEAKPHQVEDLKHTLEDYKEFGGGERAGEYNSIFYNAQKVELIQQSRDSLWLSETPNERSKGWDAKHLRTLVFGTFKDIKSGKEIFAFNSHYDHVGEKARSESAKLVLETIKKTAPAKPVIFMGDLNHTEDSKPYEIITTSDGGLNDAFYASQLPNIGPNYTFEGFKVKSGHQQKRIDYIFVNDQVRVLKHSSISIFSNGYYPSDHLPVFAKLQLE